MLLWVLQMYPGHDSGRPGKVTRTVWPVPDRPRLSRRSAVGLLGAGLTAAAAAACDPGKDIASSPSPSASPSASPSPSRTAADHLPSAAPDGDDELVASVLDQLAAAYGALVIARRFPTLRKALTPLLKAHRAHAAALGEDKVDWEAPTYADPAAALAGVRAAEQQLRSALVDAAGKADSGALARLLASASASVAQHLQTLPAPA